MQCKGSGLFCYVAHIVVAKIYGRPTVDIGEIQTAMENQLMAGTYKQAALAYIEYRHDQDV